MLIVSQSGPSMLRRYRSTVSNQARVHHRLTVRVPLHQSAHATPALLWTGAAPSERRAPAGEKNGTFRPVAGRRGRTANAFGRVEHVHVSAGLYTSLAAAWVKKAFPVHSRSARLARGRCGTTRGKTHGDRQ